MAEEEASARRRMPWYTKIIFASGHFLNALCWAVWFPYNVTFFTKVLELPSNIAGDIIITAQVFGAFSLPFIGTWSDQTQLKKFGRRKIFHLLGMVATAISFFFIWHECITCTSAPPAYQALYFASFAVVFLFGWCAIVVAQLSLIPELAPNKQTIVQLNALRNMFTYLGSIVVFICFLILLAKTNNGPGNSITPADKQIFWIMAIAVIVFGLLTVIPFQIVIRENPKIKLPTLRWFKWIQKPEFYLIQLYIILLGRWYSYYYFVGAEAVLRHMWSDESRAVRELIYTWVLGAKMYNDPIVTLATFEGIEAGLKDLFEVAYGKVFLPEEGLKDLEYFGGKHVELEQNHTQTGWFKDIYSPLAQLEITEQQKANAFAAVDAMFEKFHPVYTAMLNMAEAEDTIQPEKYQVDDNPTLRNFPKEHPNKAPERTSERDEL